MIRNSFTWSFIKSLVQTNKDERGNYGQMLSMTYRWKVTLRFYLRVTKVLNVSVEQWSTSTLY